MAQKTLPTDQPVDEFLATAEPARRRDEGARLVKIFEEASGHPAVMWGPSIVGFGEYELVSPSTGKVTGTWPIVGFSPRKAALTLYGIKETPQMQELLAQLGKYTESKACVYVKRLDEVDETVLRKLIELAIEETSDRCLACASEN